VLVLDVAHGARGFLGAALGLLDCSARLHAMP
jgi:hypothetical protein